MIYAADRVANMRDWRKVAPEDRRAGGERLGTTLEERLQLWRRTWRSFREPTAETPFLSEIEAGPAQLRPDASRRPVTASLDIVADTRPRGIFFPDPSLRPQLTILAPRREVRGSPLPAFPTP